MDQVPLMHVLHTLTGLLHVEDDFRLCQDVVLIDQTVKQLSSRQAVKEQMKNMS